MSEYSNGPDVDDQPAPEQIVPGPDTPSSTLPSILEVVASAEVLLGDVERALERLDAESYALCEICGLTIDAARLEASPVTRRCEAHSV